MEFGNYLILICAGLIFLSILAGLVSARVGAPLLLVFLALGMLAGQDGPGGIAFDDFEAAYTIGAVSLAIVLFDGGLRTSMDTMRTASWPALTLATVGVVITAGITGAAAFLIFDLSWMESFLVGAIVASTDAAAVFFLLRLRATNLVKRARATLEAESGLNDPMAVFLTITCIQLIAHGAEASPTTHAGDLFFTFLMQMVGGAAIGIAGGFGLVAAINRLKLASGLYPILALASALLVFAGAQVIGASGFLAVYICGLVLGNRRHRARQVIEQFQDGLAWLSQIVMFVMLGLLVTPSDLVANLLPAVLVAVVLILLARPVAVMLCLAPFGLSLREHAFISWVGLRGAVPIFLGTMPILAQLPGAKLYFDIAFVVVLTSLLIQGWTVTLAARLLNLALPPASGPPVRYDIDLPDDVGRDMAVFAVREGSPATRVRPADIAHEMGIEVAAVIREGGMLRPGQAGRLAIGDQVVILAAEAALPALDELFGMAAPLDRKGRLANVFGEFSFEPAIPVGDLAKAYGFHVPSTDKALAVGAFLRRHLRKAPNPGDRLRLGPVELIVQAMQDGRIARVGIELDPASSSPLSRDNLRIWSRHFLAQLRRRKKPGTAIVADASATAGGPPATVQLPGPPPTPTGETPPVEPKPKPGAAAARKPRSKPKDSVKAPAAKPAAARRRKTGVDRAKD